MQRAATSYLATSYLIGVGGLGAVAWLTSQMLPQLGLATSALLFLLPVLFAAARGALGPGLVAALGGAIAYNYFLLPPRFSFRVHGVENLVSLGVLIAVALVTSRLATLLRAREGEALARARASEDLADLAAVLGKESPDDALGAGLRWLEERYGTAALITEGTLPQSDAGFSSLDLSAAAWAIHNQDVTGHGTHVMPASDWTFLPLTPKRGRRGDADLVALARPAEGATRDERELLHLAQLALLLGQAHDRALLARERQGRERLEEADRLRRALLASLAHDFRTPLTVMTGQLEVLAQRAPEAREALAAARRLHRTMEDLIGAARIESGSLAPKMESLDVIDVVHGACAAAGPAGAVTVRRSIPPDLPFVRGDPILLHHALVNLLDNAARHARSQVTVTAAHRADRVALSICDDGPGIPEAEREAVFERFARIEGDDRGQGSGLGLAIVKGFSEAMGMSVAVSSSDTGGACLTLDLAAEEARP